MAVTTVPEALREIAASIDQRGHYQGKTGQKLWTDPASGGKCCVSFNPVIFEITRDWTSENAQLFEAVNKAFCDSFGTNYITTQDTLPTAEVVARLRSKADQIEQENSNVA